MADQGDDFRRAFETEMRASVDDVRRWMNRLPDGWVASPPPPWYRRWKWALRRRQEIARTRLAKLIAPWMRDQWED